VQVVLGAKITRVPPVHVATFWPPPVAI